LTYEEIVGSLELTKAQILQQCLEDDDEEDEEG